MSLATRCTACGTIFRVVQDQLRVSEGWVRCGRCAEVFDAREQLFDMDREAPPPWPAHAPEQPPTGQDDDRPEEASLAESVSSDAGAVPEPDEASTWVVPREIESEHAHIDIEDADAIDDRSAVVERQEPAWGHEPQTSSQGNGFGTGAGTEPGLEDLREEDEAVQVDDRLAHLVAQRSEPSPERARSEPVDVGFLSAAAGAARWRRPGVRLALGASALLMTLLLAFQMVWHFRDALLSLYPQSEPALHALCQATGCELQPWRRIDALSVDNSSLTQVGTAGNHYKLGIQLRNKAGYALALPWIDVTLTDASGTLVARRMLSPADFSAAKALIDARSEQALQIVFSTDAKVSGYSVEIFQP